MAKGVAFETVLITHCGACMFSRPVEGSEKMVWCHRVSEPFFMLTSDFCSCGVPKKEIMAQYISGTEAANNG